MASTVSSQFSGETKTINLKEVLRTAIHAAELGGREVYAVRKSNDIKETNKGNTDDGLKDPLTDGDLRSHRVMMSKWTSTFSELKIISEEDDDEVQLLQDTCAKDTTCGGAINPSDKWTESEDFTSLPDVECPIEKAVVWIDPLDATREYTENLLEYVTTMVGVAIDGVATIGVVHRPFTGETFWGWKGRGRSKSVQKMLDERETTRGPRDTFRIIVSRSHAGNAKELATLAVNKDVEVVKGGGAGYKAIEVINGTVDAYLHVTKIKKWDTCGPDGIISAIDGASFMSLKNELIDYKSGSDIWINEGFMVTVGVDDHLKIAEKIYNAKVSSTL